MTKENCFCGNCKKITVHELSIEKQVLSVRDKVVAFCTECGNATTFFPLNEEEVNINTIH